MASPFIQLSASATMAARLFLALLCATLVGCTQSLAVDFEAGVAAHLSAKVDNGGLQYTVSGLKETNVISHKKKHVLKAVSLDS